MAIITLNQKETDRMLKAKSIIESNKIRGNSFVKQDIVGCYNGMVVDISHSTSTCIDGVKEFFESMGFFIECGKYGGWDIYISERMKSLYTAS